MGEIATNPILDVGEDWAKEHGLLVVRDEVELVMWLGPPHFVGRIPKRTDVTVVPKGCLAVQDELAL